MRFASVTSASELDGEAEAGSMAMGQSSQTKIRIHRETSLPIRGTPILTKPKPSHLYPAAKWHQARQLRIRQCPLSWPSLPKALGLKQAGFQPCRHIHPHLFTLGQELFLKLAPADQGFPYRPPAQSRHNGFHRPPGSGAIMPGPNHQRIGLALGFLQTRIIDPVKAVLEGTAHISQVFRGSQNNAIRRQYIFRPGLQGRQPACLHSGNVRMGGTTQHGLYHGLNPGGWRMRQDQQLLCRTHRQTVLPNNLSMSDRSKGDRKSTRLNSSHVKIS